MAGSTEPGANSPTDEPSVARAAEATPELEDEATGTQPGESGEQPGKGGEQARKRLPWDELPAPLAEMKAEPARAASGEMALDPRVARAWGNLPPRLRSEFIANGDGAFPPRYRSWIDAYYERLNQLPE